jgi:hypothetical protein
MKIVRIRNPRRARPLFHASRAFGSWFQHGIRDLASAICVYSLTELHMYIWITFDFGGTVRGHSHRTQPRAAAPGGCAGSLASPCGPRQMPRATLAG